MRTPSIAAILALLAPAAVAADLPGEPTGHVLIRFDAEPSSATLDRLASAHGAGIQHLSGSWPVYALTDPKSDPVALAAVIQARTDVRWAYPDLIVQTELHALPLDDTYADQLWHLENVGQVEGALPGMDINVLPAWEITNGDGILIGIIDGGVEEHVDLATVQPGIDKLDGDGDASPGAEQSNPAHGTVVAGVAGAIGNNGQGVAGVAWAAEILPVRLVGGGASLQQMYEAFVESVDRGAHVLNNSWGFNTEEPCDSISDLPPLNEGIAYARDVGRDGLGTVVVFSAGNSGCEQNDYPMLRDNENVIAVGSINDRAVKWGYSVWGNHVDIGAPSGGLGGGGGRPGLYSTDMFGDVGFNGAGENNEYTDRMGGTSGAAPVVSGTVALMLAANPRITEAEVRRVLCATATKVDPTGTTYDSTGWSPYYGCGRVDAGAAVVAVANEAPPAPVLTTADGASMSWDDATFTWTNGADPDGDPLTWALELTPIDVAVPPPLDEQPLVLRAGLIETSYTLRGLRWATGTWEARVVASDLWGRGAWSEPITFTLTDPPPAPPPTEGDEGTGCQSNQSPGHPGRGIVLALALLLGGVRRLHGDRARE